jgi:hypothetical protein
VSAWFAIPSARRSEDAGPCLRAWRERGYLIALLRDDFEPDFLELADHVVAPRRYQGWASAVNILARVVLEADPECRVLITGGDDVYPAPDHVTFLEQQFVHHFNGTLGVMQPDGHLDWSPMAPQIAWSPWLGREWCLRANGGKGPLWPEYFHGWADLELRQVASRLGLFWSRPDLTQRHEKHTSGLRPGKKHADEHGAADREVYGRRQRRGFPGHELAS